MCIKRYSFFYSIFLFLPSIAFCQRLWENYEIFNTHWGLPNNAALSITQDDHNLLWIGTRNGLCVYDGYEFEVKKDMFGAKDGELGNIFCSLFKDASGNIWICTQTGNVGEYNSKLDSVRQYTIEGLSNNEYIVCFYQDIKGTIWLGSSCGRLYSIQKRENKIIEQATIEQGPISSITEDFSGNLLVNGIYKIRLPGSYENSNAHSQQAMYITFYSNGIDIHKKNSKIIRIKENEIVTKRHYVSYITKAEKILIATAQVVKKFDENGRLLQTFVVGDETNYNNEDLANFIFEDASGIIWLGTNFGLLKINEDKYRFTKFTTNSTFGKLNSNYVRSVFVDNDTNIWVGYKAGFVNRLFERGALKYETLTYKYNNPKEPISAINIIRQLKSGMLLFGGEGGLFYAYQKGRHLLYNYFLKDTNNKSIKLSEVWSIFEDKKGRVWVGTHSEGLFVIDFATHTYKCYKNIDNSKSDKTTTSIWQIERDYKGSIWLATENGLDSVTLNSDGYPQGFYNLHKHYQGQPGQHVWSIVEDNKHRLWIGTTDNGISMVDKSRRLFINYNKKNGLQDNVVCGILSDERGYLWISTLIGISKFDTKNRVFQNFTENDGLMDGDFNFNACSRSPTGYFYWGSKSGMITFHPNSVVKKNMDNVSVLIRAFSIGNEKRISNPDINKPIYLQHNQNSFSARFVMTDYTSPISHYFKYILKGFNDNWITTNAMHPIATYTNVPPGRYTLLVKGSADGGKWGKKVTRLVVVIYPALWQRPIFIVSIIIATIFMIVIIIYARYQSFKTKNEEKHRINQKFAELELRALQAQMNPHFIFNSINAIQHFIIHKDEIAANDYLSRFAKLMRLFLESSKNKYIQVEKEIELLQLYLSLEKLRFDDKFDYEISIDQSAEEIKNELIPSMLIQPFAENAIKHGLIQKSTKGNLKILFSVLKHKELIIKCVIDDDGIGRKKAAQINALKKTTHISRGTDMIDERIKTYNFIDEQHIQIFVTDKEVPESGTRVEILIPVHP